MKVVTLKRSVFPSLEEASTAFDSERGQVKILVRNLQRFNVEVASDIYLSSFNHIPFRFNNHLTTVEKLYGKDKLLDDMKLQILNNFAGIKAAEALASRIESLRAYAVKNFNKSMEQMAKCCLKYQPAYYTTTLDYAEKVLKALQKTGRVTRTSERYQLARSLTLKKHRGEAKARQASQFVTYFRVNASDNPRTEVWLAVTCLVDAYGRFKMGVAVLPSFLPPGTFKCASTIRNHVSCKGLIPKLLGV